MGNRSFVHGLCVLFLTVGAASAGDAFEAEPILYSQASNLNDPAARLQRRLDRGELQLRHDKEFGYLPSLLKQLGIPRASQVLVFSKTSLQLDFISPRTPRAVYHNEHSYVGFTQGGVLEIASVDPKLGTNFYTLKQAKAALPKLVRGTAECLQCHATARTRRVPGLLVRSVFPDRSGHPILRGGSYNTTHASPIAKRWGGWYVGGRRIELSHMGNALVGDRKAERVALTQPINGPSHADPHYDPERYLEPTSDVASLMVLEHQILMQNVLFEARYQTIWALREQAILDRLSDEKPNGLTPSINGRIDRAADRVVHHLFFVDEAPIEKPIVGYGAFRKAFEAAGRKGPKGQTLRKLELAGRTFTLPMSFLIHGETFDALPEILHKRVVQRVNDVLSGRNQDPMYQHIDAQERQAILRILRATTKPWAKQGQLERR